MTRKFKALGLALVAVLALSAIAASAAQAAGHKIDIENETGVITATGDPGAATQILETSSASVSCKNVHLTGTIPKELNNTEVTLIPRYTECTLGSETMTVTPNHCAYILTGDTDVNGDAPFHIECAPGQTITMVTSLCTLKIGEQTPKGGVHYVDTKGTSGKEEITIEETLSGVKYTKEGGFGCLFFGNGEDAVYKGKTTVGVYVDTKKVEGTALTTDTEYADSGVQKNLKLTTNAT